MDKFNGIQMLKIDIANQYGKDKESWTDRLLWTELRKNNLRDYAESADEPMMYLKAVQAYEDTMDDIPSGHNMFLDATASGLQVMAALSGCHKTAKQVNMINTGSREDVYSAVAILMNKELSIADQVTRKDCKLPVMTHFYCKMTQETFNENQQNAFYNVLSHNFEGAEAVKDTITDHWNKYALQHSWTMPDNWMDSPLKTCYHSEVQSLEEELKCLKNLDNKNTVEV